MALFYHVGAFLVHHVYRCIHAILAIANTASAFECVHISCNLYYTMHTGYASIGGDYGGGLQMEWLSVHWSHYTKYSTGGFCGQCKAVVGTKFYCDIIS